MNMCKYCAVFKILPEEDDYGFDIEEKNKAIVVKSVRRESSAEVGPHIHILVPKKFHYLEKLQTSLLKSVSFKGS